MPHAMSSGISITPLEHGPDCKANFGATLTGVDLNNIDDTSFQTIRQAIYEHTVLVVKNQHDLLPKMHQAFMQRLDPDAIPSHGFRTTDGGAKLSGNVGKTDSHTVPGTTAVKLLGQGYQGDDHFGLKGLTLKATPHSNFHGDPLTYEEVQQGSSRFGHWHFDGIVYGTHPSRVGSIRCIRAPKGPDVTVRWDDGTGRTLKAKAGGTAFISSSQIYDLMTEEEKQLADNSSWEIAPNPFVWTGTRRTRSVGLGHLPGGKVMPLDELPPWEASKIRRYPMVWLNPVTGKKCLQASMDIVRILYLKTSPDGEETIIKDPEYIRTFFNKIWDRILEPEYIVIPPVEEGDMILWNNWGAMHSAVEYPDRYGVRTMHQCHLGSSTAPQGPQGQVPPPQILV